MGDVGETFNQLKKQGQEKRGKNRKASPEILKNAGIVFESKNGGSHLVVGGPGCFIDFWPGTGRWISRNGAKGFGVRNLIKHING